MIVFNPFIRNFHDISRSSLPKNNFSSKKPTFFNASVDINIQKPINNLDSNGRLIFVQNTK